MLFICSCIRFTLLPLGNIFTRDAEIRYLNVFMILKVKTILSLSDFHNVFNNQNKFFPLSFL